MISRTIFLFLMFYAGFLNANIVTNSTQSVNQSWFTNGSGNSKTNVSFSQTTNVSATDGNHKPERYTTSLLSKCSSGFNLVGGDCRKEHRSTATLRCNLDNNFTAGSCVVEKYYGSQVDGCGYRIYACGGGNSGSSGSTYQKVEKEVICPSGFSPMFQQCVKYEYSPVIQYCPSGYKREGDLCAKYI